MQLYLLALNPTDSVTDGFLPAALRLGLTVTVLTDQPAAHRAAVPDGVEVRECRVRDFRAVVALISAHRPPGVIFSNSDHLQVQTALAAAYFGLPGKDWRVALRTKDKAEMRRWLAAAPGLPATAAVRAVELPAGREALDDLVGPEGVVPFPCVVKPAEGVASEDVVLVRDRAELAARRAEIRARRPGAALVAEEFLPGELHTLETLGDGRTRRVLGGFRTRLSPPPYFIEERLTWEPGQEPSVVTQVLDQLDALGAGFGACHTEYMVDSGRARIVEVNYRSIGDQCDLLLAELLGVPLFELILRVHQGEPLPPDPWPAPGRAACLAYPYARTAGTLTAAPGPEDLALDDGVRLAYRPLRAVGSHQPVHHTNRDLLGVVRVIGPDQQAVDRAADAYVAARTWEITP
ncbi:MAG TPA: siderophore biosynthesis protein [Streptomyces sp.]